MGPFFVTNTHRLTFYFLRQTPISSQPTTAELILNGLDNSDITVLSPEEPFFSRQNMGRAFEYLAPYLLPEPTAEDKIDYTKFRIMNDARKITKFVEDHILNATVLSLETMLLVIECLIRSSDKMKKAICRNFKTR